jgi:O-antigen ligase
MAQAAGKASARDAGLLQYLFAAFGMVLYQDALTTPMRWLRGLPALKPGETEVTNTIGQLLVLVGVFVFLWKYRRSVIASLRVLLPVLILLALCFASAAWSTHPMNSVRRSVTLSICVSFGICCYFQLGLAKTIELLAKTTAVLAVLSLMAYYFVPALGRETALNYENALRGVYSQKNSIGAAMLLASNYFVFAAFGGARFGIFSAMAAAATLACLVLSLSATSLIIFASIVLLNFWHYTERSWRLRVILGYLVAAMTLVVAIALIAAPAEVFALFNRDLTFTGRVPLWQMTLKAVAAKPILGYGFAGFWNTDSVLVQRIWRTIGWNAPDAHNGYIDVLLQLGVIGLALCIWIWGKIISLTGRVAKNRSFKELYWLIGFIIINVVLNLDEGSQPAATQFTLLIPVIILTLVSLQRTGQRVRRNVSDDLVAAPPQ